VHDILAGNHAQGVLVKTDDLTAARKVLAGAGMIVTANGEALRVAYDPARAADVTKALAASGLYVSELRPDVADLETVFLELTQEVRS
jgi:hypothetical protein